MNDRARQVGRVGRQPDGCGIDRGDVIGLAVGQVADARAAAIAVNDHIPGLKSVLVSQVDVIIGGQADRSFTKLRRAAIRLGQRARQFDGGGIDHGHVIDAPIDQPANRIIPAVAINHEVTSLEAMDIAQINRILGRVNPRIRREVAAAERHILIPNEGLGVPGDVIDARRQTEADTGADAHAAHKIHVERIIVRGHGHRAGGRDGRPLADLGQGLVVDRDETGDAVDRGRARLAPGNTEGDIPDKGLRVNHQVMCIDPSAGFDHGLRCVVIEQPAKRSANAPRIAAIAELGLPLCLPQSGIQNVGEIANQVHRTDIRLGRDAHIAGIGHCIRLVDLRAGFDARVGAARQRQDGRGEREAGFVADGRALGERRKIEIGPQVTVAQALQDERGDLVGLAAPIRGVEFGYRI